MSYQSRQIKAIKLAIEALVKERRKFSSGHVAYEQQHIRPVEINSEGITGVTMGFAEDEHRKYKELDDAIQAMEDLIEIITDPGVTYEGNSDLPLFVEMEKNHGKENR